VDFTSSITLKFNDLFSTGIRGAREDLLGFKTSLEDIGNSPLAPGSLEPPSSGLAGMELPKPVIPAPDLPPPATLPSPKVPVPEVPSPKTSVFTAGLKQIESGLDKIGKNTALNQVAAQLSVMAQMTAPARDALASMMDEPSRLAGTFDSSMRNIQSLTGETEEELSALQNKLLEVGAGAVAGPNAIAGAYYNIASGVGDAAVRMDTLKAAVALAESGQADLGAATSGLISVVNAYGTKASDMTKMSDVFFQTVRKGVGSLDGFVGSMSSIAGLSASVGIGFDELGSSMAFITAKGQTESVAATQLKAAMSSLLNPNKELAEALKRVGITSGSAMMQEYGLAESLNIVKQAVGGSQDAMAKALGSNEALQAAIALTADDYTAFASTYAAELPDATAKGLEKQALSYEARVARLQSASDTLKIRIGGDINHIKGFFVDMGAGFLTHVAGPLLSSPVGGVFSKIAAYAGMGVQGVLSFGGGALTAASQLSVLAANVKNAGGYMEMFKGTMSLAAAPFKAMGSGIAEFGKGIAGALPKMGAWIASSWSAATANTAAFGSSVFQKFQSGIAGIGKGIAGALPKMGAWIASTWSAAAAHIAAAWPIYAIIAGVAALAAAVYLVIKNWDAVSGFFTGLWNKIKILFQSAIEGIKNIIFGASDWVLAALAVFFPIIGIPALIIKHWEGIKTFFAALFTTIKAAIQSFVDWLGGIVQAITAPFAAIGDTASGVFSKIGGFFKGLGGGGAESGKALPAAFAQGIRSNAAAPVEAFTVSLEGVGQQLPHSDARKGPLSRLTASGRALTETFASGMDGTALTKKTSTVFQEALPEIPGTASALPASPLTQAEQPPSVFTEVLPELTRTATASLTRGVIQNAEPVSVFAQTVPNLTRTAAASLNAAADLPISARDTPEADPLRRQAALAFQTPPAEKETIRETFTREAPDARGGPSSVSVQNMYLQAEDCQTIFDFVRMIQQAAHNPAGAPV
jgi:TP901 family phage tail tape measure protein